MTHAAYVFAGYGLTVTLIGAYAAWLLRRRRVVAALVSSEAGDQTSGRPGS
jgi:uncharacterized protein (TIGR03382 family)